jgi:hypothetical protein
MTSIKTHTHRTSLITTTESLPVIDVKSRLVSAVTYPKGVPFSYEISIISKPVLPTSYTLSELHSILEEAFIALIKESNGNDWQARFSWIALRKFPGVFKEMPPYKEDKGNDGWLEKYGIYFQCYGPFKTAQEQIKDFIKKIYKDTHKVIRGWDNVDKVKEYHFVWNTKFSKSVDAQMLKDINGHFNALMKKYSIKIGLITAETLLIAFRTLTFNEQLEFLGWAPLKDIIVAAAK